MGLAVNVEERSNDTCVFMFSHVGALREGAFGLNHDERRYQQELDVEGDTLPKKVCVVATDDDGSTRSPHKGKLV